MFEHSATPDNIFDCHVTFIDGIGNMLLYDLPIPVNVEFEGFLTRLQVDTFRSLSSVHDESDYASWAKRLDFLSTDKPAIAKLEKLIDQHKQTDYEKLAEWLWVCEDRTGDVRGMFITGEKDFKAFMALASSKKLGKGCLMRVSESKFHEIIITLKHLEMKEDRRGQERCEEAFCELERRQGNKV
ncbi:hypothetical protein N0V93_005265 [Gnomoniopsis smithogilvyi]|uniref:Uncharacterized protein n=1 Tax=Gnomoniopsis smithogilvyi TaxID=1191159 RepID=A0A9W8YSK1_9PEZI|nr:hypothetical protein N0V93_005265 [Gnomoniopsis smithogilvyi]